MAQRTSWSAGQVLAQAEGSIGTTVRAAVANYYKGHDLNTAQTIRRAETDTEAAKYVTAIRQGRVHEVVPTVAGMGLQISLSGRSMLAAGGLSYITGAVIYHMLAPKAETAS